MLLQTIVELCRHDRKMQRIRCVLRKIQESATNTLVAIFQTQVQHFTLLRGERPQEFAFRDAEAQGQCQPRLTDLRCARQNM